MVHHRKKASINLSIEAIVILVMAITMLGLGLGFIRSKFGAAGGLIDDVQDKVKDQVQQDLLNSDKKISFAKTEFTLKSKQSDVTVFGIRNFDPSPLTIFIYITDEKGVSCFGQECGEVTISGAQKNAYQFTFSQSYTIPAGGSQLIPLKIQMKESNVESLLFNIEIHKGTIPADPIYVSKQIFVKGV